MNNNNRQQHQQRELLQVGPQIQINTWEGMQTKGMVELRLIDKKNAKYKDQHITFRSYPDKLGVTWGIPIRVYQNGDMEWQQIRLRGDVMVFNLANPREAKEFHIIRNSPFVEGSPTASIDIRYRIYDADVEAAKEIDTYDDLFTAIDFIKKMDHNQVIAYGRLFGISPDTNSPVVIRKTLLEKAKLNPDSILKKMSKESETEIFIVLKRAMDTGYIKTVPDRGLLYNDQIALGLTEHAAIEYLRENPTILMDMDKTSKQKDRFYNPVEKSSSNESKKKADEQF